MKTLYLECNMGAAGDMLLAALYELLPDPAGFIATMNALGLPDVTIAPRAATTCGIAGTHMEVRVAQMEEDDLPRGYSHAHHHDHDHDHGHDHDHSHDHSHEHDHDHSPSTQPHFHATPGHIAGIIEGLPLPQAVLADARAVYDRIALAEAAAHGCPVGDVHFHEVGALDAIADIVGVCYALHLLAPTRIIASPVHVGSGNVRCSHGIVPVPAPATARLLAGIPAYGGEIAGELCTPTGAALLAHFAASFGPMPPMATERIGYGIGKRVFAQANCVRAFYGVAQDAANGSITELVCSIDDMSAEALACACGRLLALGALDVYLTAGTMKKGRPGHVLTVLCSPEQEAETARAVLRETTTNGLRVRRCGKYYLNPRVDTLDTPFGAIRIKRAEGWGVSHRKPEYEDVAAAAMRANLPFHEVWQRIQAQLAQTTPDEPQA